MPPVLPAVSLQQFVMTVVKYTAKLRKLHTHASTTQILPLTVATLASSVHLPSSLPPSALPIFDAFLSTLPSSIYLN